MSVTVVIVRMSRIAVGYNSRCRFSYIIVMAMLNWIESNGVWLGWTAAASLISMVLIFIAVPAIVARLPQDYFTHPRREPAYLGYPHPLIGMLVAGLKNVLGLMLVVVGIVMLLTPGQGILTIFLGILLLNFPGKYQLELWFVRQPKVLPAINWLRAKLRKPPLRVPPRPHTAEQVNDV